MQAKTRPRRFTQRTIKQVRLDATRALIRARFCPDRSEVLQMRCVERREETETTFGSQLWYFEGSAVDEADRRQTVYGAIEYSIQYGTHEVLDDGIFESDGHRAGVRQHYFGIQDRPSLRQPAHRWLMIGVATVALAYLAYLAVRISTW